MSGGKAVAGNTTAHTDIIPAHIPAHIDIIPAHIDIIPVILFSGPLPNI